MRDALIRVLQMVLLSAKDFILTGLIHLLEWTNLSLIFLGKIKMFLYVIRVVETVSSLRRLQDDIETLEDHMTSLTSNLDYENILFH